VELERNVNACASVARLDDDAEAEAALPEHAR
jgi:hypothetical protein